MKRFSGSPHVAPPHVVPPSGGCASDNPARVDLRTSDRLKAGLRATGLRAGGAPCDSQSGRIPFRAVPLKGIFAPDALSFVAPHRFQIPMGAAPGPFGPKLHISVVNGIIMDVIRRRPEMPFGSNRSIRGAMEYLSASSVLLSIPSMGSASVKSSQFANQAQHIFGFDERMVMVGQDAPGVENRSVLGEYSEQRQAKNVHSRLGHSDMVGVLVTRGRDVEVQMSEVGPMWRAMPGTFVALPPGEQFFALFECQLTPNITRRGHRRRLLKSLRRSKEGDRLKPGLHTSRVAPSHVVPPSGGSASNNPARSDLPTSDRLKPGLRAWAAPFLFLRSLRLNLSDTHTPYEMA